MDKASEQLGITGMLTDQSNLQDIDALVKEINGTLAKVDVLFVNAGVAFCAPIAYTSEAQFDTMVDVNFKGS